MRGKSKFVVSLLAGWALLCLPAFGQKSSLGSPGPTPVLVVNGTGAPVPVAPQGTTNVAGTINVGNTPNVNVANMPNVNIANTPSVSILGSPTVTLAPGASTGVNNVSDGQGNAVLLGITEGTQFYEDRCSASFNGSAGAGCNLRSVPSGKLLVIQEFDADIKLTTGVRPETVFLETADIVHHYFSDTFMATDFDSDIYAAHQATHLYSGAGTTPNCNVLTNSNASVNGFVNCEISGFLVDQP